MNVLEYRSALGTGIWNSYFSCGNRTGWEYIGHNLIWEQEFLQMGIATSDRSLYVVVMMCATLWLARRAFDQLYY